VRKLAVVEAFNSSKSVGSTAFGATLSTSTRSASSVRRTPHWRSERNLRSVAGLSSGRALAVLFPRLPRTTCGPLRGTVSEAGSTVST
jgi:hypothetical protein